ncbi:unnamed protein product [Phaeothamnion confervicola]
MFDSPLLAGRSKLCTKDGSPLRSVSRDEWYAASVRELRERVVPGMEAAMAIRGAATYMDLGHHFAAGCLLFEAIAAELGDELCVVRIRRARLEVAYSMTNSHREKYGDLGIGPCGGKRQDFWVVCRTTDSVLHLSDEQWEALTRFQRWLWAIDEMEARWVLLRRQFPQLRTTDVRWSDELRPEHLAPVAALLGGAVSPTSSVVAAAAATEAVAAVAATEVADSGDILEASAASGGIGSGTGPSVTPARAGSMGINAAGIVGSGGVAIKHHVRHDDPRRNMTALAEADAAYRAIAAYPPEVLTLIAGRADLR